MTLLTVSVMRYYTSDSCIQNLPEIYFMLLKLNGCGFSDLWSKLIVAIWSCDIASSQSALSDHVAETTGI